MNAAQGRTMLLAVAIALVANRAAAQNLTKMTDFSPDVIELRGDCSSGGNYFFNTRDRQDVVGFWKTDGTVSGTTLLTTFTAFCSHMTDVNGILCFVGHDDEHGVELWQSDGTTSGTFMVADIRPGPDWSSPGGLQNVNGTLVFKANDHAGGQSNYQVWAYTPTPAPPPPDPGDVNRDDKTDVADVVALIEIITSSTATATPPAPVIRRVP